jgi:hypothetical protein
MMAIGAMRPAPFHPKRDERVNARRAASWEERGCQRWPVALAFRPGPNGLRRPKPRPPCRHALSATLTMDGRGVSRPPDVLPLTQRLPPGGCSDSR